MESKYHNNATIKETDLILKAALLDHPGYIITKSPDGFGLIRRSDGQAYQIPAPAYLYLMGLMQQKANRLAL